MKNKNKSRLGFIHLYNPKEEGLGSYDIHYINVYRKNKVLQKGHDLIDRDVA